MDIVYASMLVDKLRNKQTNWFLGVYTSVSDAHRYYQYW